MMRYTLGAYVLVRMISSEPAIGDVTAPKYAVQLLTSALPPKSTPPSTAQSVAITKKGGTRYRCHLPSANSSGAVWIGTKQAAPPKIARYLPALRGTCFYRIEGWWTYEFCFHKSIRQFHQEKVKSAAGTSVDQVTQEYVLGAYWPSPPPPPVLAHGYTSPATPSAIERAWADSFKGELREDGKSRRKYWSSLYGNGTLCDLNGKPRETEVRLSCAPGEPSFLSSVEEVSTCRYLVQFSTALLCKHPAFTNEHEPESLYAIKCEPVGANSDFVSIAKKADDDAFAAAAEAAASAADAPATGAALRATRGVVSPPVLAFDLGEAAVHYKYNYRGIIVGYDRSCLQSEAWIKSMGVDGLKHGRAQPFYHVLPDTRDRPGALITYIAQESMLPDAPSAPFRHPMTAELFTGFEPSTGRHVPSAKLRSRYPLAERGL